MQTIPEKDWKKMRSIEKKLLNQFCGTILEKAETIIAGKKDREHEAYIDLWKMLKREDSDLSIIFDDMKRSNAFYKLADWKNKNLLLEDDMKEFSEETQKVIQVLTEM